jgi:hypothetical protein
MKIAAIAALCLAFPLGAAASHLVVIETHVVDPPPITTIKPKGQSWVVVDPPPITITDQDEVQHETVTVTVTTETPSPASAFPIPDAGIALGYFVDQTSAARARQLDKAKAVGAEYVRFDSDPDGHQLNVEETVNMAVARGLETVLILNSSNTQAQVGTPAEAAAFAKAQAQKFVRKVRFFEFLNEPDLHGWTPEQYAAYLKAVYVALKEGNPNAYLSTAGLWTWHKGTGGPDAREWTRRFYAAGAKGFFDAFAMHLYNVNDHSGYSPWWMTFEAPDSIRTQMNAAGDSAVPVWSSENGWNVNWPSPFCTGLSGEACQAKMVDGEFDALSQYPLKSLAWYMIEDLDIGFGLTRPDGTQRPSHDRYRARAG